MPTTYQLTGGTLGAKAVSLGDFDDFLDWLVSGGGEDNPQELYAAVSWVFWCVNLRANAVASIPFGVYREGEEDFTAENEVDFDLDLTPYLWSAEAWLCLKAAAYWLKRRNRVTVADLQILNSNTMRVIEWDADGPTVFEQKVGAKTKRYKAEDVVYFRTFNPANDIGEGVAPSGVGQVPATLVHHANSWASAFFSNGAIPAVLLTTDGAVPPGEKQRIESRWEKMLKGVQKAFKTAVLERGPSSASR
jgi:phage portal protein BeeE